MWGERNRRRQELQSCKTLATTLKLPSEKLEEAKQKMLDDLGRAAAMRSEAILVSIASDGELSHPAKQTKISKEYDRLTRYSQDVGVDLKTLVHGRVVKETIGKILYSV